MRLIIFFFLSVILGCENTQSKSIDITINELSKINKSRIYGTKSSFLSRSRGDYRIIVTDYYSSSKGGVLLKFNGECKVYDIDYSMWKDSLDLKLATIKGIGKCLCEIGLNSISVDSCGNTYFTVSNSSMYDYVIVENKDCLNDRFGYSLYKDNCYKVIW